MLNPTDDQRTILSNEVPTPIAVSATSRQLLQDTEVPVVHLGQWALVWIRLRHHRLAMIGMVTIAGLILIAIFAPIISPEDFNGYNYSAVNISPRLTYPGAKDWEYLLGTDVNGHALLMWVTYGARVSLAVGMLSALLTTSIAIIVGATAGYFGGWVDAVVMRITDVFLTLPVLPLLILISAYIGHGSMWLIIGIFAFLAWPATARLVRSYYLTFRQQEFTQAARAVGVSDARIIFRHILPNALSPLIVATTLAVAGFIHSEAAIDYLGVGIKPPSVSWGLALSNSQQYFGVGNWWWAFFPGMFLLIVTLAVNFFGDGLRDALDVRTGTR